MRSVLVLALALGACGKRGDRVAASARDTVPIAIITSFPGASPVAMAESVTTPIERQLGQTAHLVALHSRSVEGRSVVVAEFASGTDVDVASREVQKALDAAMTLLPQELPVPPTYTRKAVTGAVLRLTLASKTLPLVEVSELATSIVAQKLSQVAGVGDVTVCGPEATTRITIDPLALAATGKTIEDVRIAIAGGSITPPVAAGSLSAGDRGIPVQTVDDPRGGYQNIPIVRDTARVENSEAGGCVAIGTYGARVVGVTVTPQVGADPLAVRERLEAILPGLTAALPPALQLDVWPRTQPVAYEVLLEPGMTLARRIDELERALTALQLATRSLVQLGDADRGPDVADLWIVPPGENARDLDEAVAATCERFHLTVLDRRDHVVGFSGADVVELSKERDALLAALAKTKDFHVVEQLGGDERPQPVFRIDRERVATLGVSAHDIATTLNALAPGGMVVATRFTQLSESRVMLAVNGQFPDVLGQVMVRSTSGSLVPLSAVTSVTETREPTVIFHEGQFPWIGVRVAGPLDALEDVLAKIPISASIHRELREPD